MAQFVINFGLRGHMYLSYHGFDRLGKNQRRTFDETNQMIGDTWFNQTINHDALFDMLPITTGIDEFDTNCWGQGNPRFYDETFASVVMETYINQDHNVFFTEKTFKPLAYGHPFLLYSSAGALARLREFGFDTYENPFNTFNTEYDSNPDGQLRLEDIFRIVLALCQVPPVGIMELYHHSLNQTHHNYHHFWHTMPERYQKEMPLVIEQVRAHLV